MINAAQPGNKPAFDHRQQRAGNKDFVRDGIEKNAEWRYHLQFACNFGRQQYHWQPSATTNNSTQVAGRRAECNQNIERRRCDNPKQSEQVGQMTGVHTNSPCRIIPEGAASAM